MDNLELNFAQWLNQLEKPKEDPVEPIKVGQKLKFYPPMGKVQPVLTKKLQTNEIAGATFVVYDPKVKPKQDWNYEGAAGSSGTSPKEWPIGYKPKGKKKRGK